MKRRILTGRIAVLGGLLCLSALSFAAGSLRGLYLDGRPVTTFDGARYASVDVEIGRDGVVRITSRPDTLKHTGELLGARVGADMRTAPPGQPGSSATPSAPAEGRARPDSGSPAGARSADAAPTDASTGKAPGKDAAPLPLEGRYWIGLRDIASPAGLQVRVQLNGQTVGEFASGETRVVEVTPFLRRGENLARLEFRAVSAQTPTEPQAAAARSALEVVLAPGRVLLDQDQIALAYPIFSSRREAATEPGPAEELRFVLPPPNLP